MEVQNEDDQKDIAQNLKGPFFHPKASGMMMSSSAKRIYALFI
jgi:hypothetical protein